MATNVELTPRSRDGLGRPGAAAHRRRSGREVRPDEAPGRRRARVIILAMLFVALVARALAPYDPYVGDYGLQFARPSAEHWFGTDEFGRDVMSRIMYGARIALFVGFTASFAGCTIGGLLGVISAYWGGKVDLLLERIMDILLAFPQLILALAIASILGPVGPERGDRHLDPRHPARRAGGAGGRAVGEGERLRRGRAGPGRLAAPHHPPAHHPERHGALHHHAHRAARRPPSWPRRPSATWGWARRSRRRRGA